MKLRDLPVLAAGFLALGLASAPAQANLVTNGGFETPNVASSQNVWFAKGIGNTSITGWTVVGNTISLQNNTAFAYVGVVASEGQQLLDLTGNVGRGGGVRHDPIATDIGATYRLQFDVGAFFVGTSSVGNAIVDLWIDGIASGSFTNIMSLTHQGSDWETETVDFVATGSQTTIEIRSSLSTSSSNLGVGLDNVRLSLTAPAGSVPEPASLLLVAAALLGLGAACRRSGR